MVDVVTFVQTILAPIAAAVEAGIHWKKMVHALVIINVLVNMCICEVTYFAAQPCPNLMRPQHGNISCTGPQVTDENCTFTCDLGYELYGSTLHHCLPDNTWSGVPVTCLIMSCPELTEPLNGAIILPCEHEFRSTCNLRCDDGFYRNDDLTQSCVLSLIIVLWSGQKLLFVMVSCLSCV